VAQPDSPGPSEAEVDEQTVALVNALEPHIAYVLSPRFDVLTHNRGAEVIMSDLFTAPPPQRNMLMYMFDGRVNWSRSAEWEATARANLLDFRTEYDRHPDDPAYQQLIDDLSRHSDALRGWWAEHGVQAPEPVRKTIMHATLGPLHLLQSQARLANQPSLRLRILVPEDGRTRRVLADACTPALA
jgi:hypothetical protein